MNTPTIHPRSAWTSVAPTGITRVSWPSIKIVNIHWPARTGTIARDRTSIVRALEAWRRFHMSDRGWRDIAYNVAVDLNGDVWILRGWDVQDGGVAGRSDDVTILLVMGTGDKMTDAMKRSTLWAMREFERRKGGQLVRSYHGALQSTSCPGPEATAWAKAGFPAPAPTTTPEEPEMITAEDRAAIANDVLWTLVGFRPANNRNLWDSDAHLLVQQGQLAGQVAGLTAALGQVSAGQPIDADAIKVAVTDALAEHTDSMAAVVDGLRATVDGLSGRLDAEARDALTAALDRAREAVTA